MAVSGKVALVVLLCLMVASAPSEGAMTCQMVVSSLYPCAPYLTRGGSVPSSCCSGITSLYRSAATTVDRQTACRCMEQAAGMIHGINIENAASLPGKCDVKVPYKISPTTDCSKVH